MVLALGVSEIVNSGTVCLCEKKKGLQDHNQKQEMPQARSKNSSSQYKFVCQVIVSPMLVVAVKSAET